MRLRKYKILFPVLFAIALFTSFNTVNDPDPKDEKLLNILRNILTRGHYQPQEINDSFSQKVYNSFLENIDPSKRYFLQSDIDEFSKYKNEIDNDLRNEKLTFFFLVYDRFKERTDEAKNYYKEILNQKFDYKKDEILDVDYDNSNYLQTVDELKEFWRKQLKYSALSRVYDRIEENEDKLKEDENFIPQKFDSIEIKSRKAVLNNMDEFFIRFDELTYFDWFSTYVNCISEEFDPHTTYFSPTIKKRFDQSMSGKLEGIGARLQKENDYTKVTELVSGGPAWKQGELEVGDLILKVAQGEEEPLDIVGMRLDNAIEFIKGKKGTEVQLTVKKIDGTTKIISIIRDVVELEETFLKSSIVEKDGRTFGLINLPKFYIDFKDKDYRNCASDMKAEIERLKESNVEGIILDLRFNGGGSLSTVVEMSGLFIKDGPVVQVKFKDSDPKVKSDEDSNISWDGPLVVLVNELSASASEIFAAAMQDYKRAVIIGGKQTYGKGTVQSVVDLNNYHKLNEDLGALKLTVQKFYRINGNSNQLEGVHSDVMLPSRYTYLNIGERDYETALNFDTVEPSNYIVWNNYENFETVINNSKERVSENETFKLIDDNAKWLKKSQEDTTVFLNLTKYTNDIKSHKEKSSKYESINDFSTNLTFDSPLYEQSLIKTDEDLAEKREVWHKSLKEDIYINEAINVLSELKIKSDYLLVKK